ncbi:MAG: hypothetical protein AAF311_01245 [Pseudomonadota bacterium]
MAPYLAALRLLLAIVLALPSSLAVDSADTALICNPSGQPVSAEARAALSELEATLRAATGEPVAPEMPPHCEDCLPAFMAIVDKPAGLVAHLASGTVQHHLFATTARPFVRGPPLGSRAPPSSV